MPPKFKTWQKKKEICYVIITFNNKFWLNPRYLSDNHFMNFLIMVIWFSIITFRSKKSKRCQYILLKQTLSYPLIRESWERHGTKWSLFTQFFLASRGDKILRGKLEKIGQSLWMKGQRPLQLQKTTRSWKSTKEIDEDIWI